jgi:TRAP-type transport system small permease protein
LSSLPKLLDRVLFHAIALLLAAMVADVAIQVFFRYVIHDPPTWTEELARYLFAWKIFLAAGLAFGRGSHIAVDVLLMVLPAPAKRMMLVVSNLLVLGMLLVLIWQGLNMVGMTSNTTSTAMGMNMGVVYAALPTGAAIGALYTLLRLVDLVRGGERRSSAPRLTAVD